MPRKPRLPRQPRQQRTDSVPYSELLKDPRWQKRKTEIMERDGMVCVFCDAGLGEKILQVHHKRYDYGKMPWEYNDTVLETLCEDCHRKQDALRKKAKALFAEAQTTVLPEFLIGILQGAIWEDLPNGEEEVRSAEQADGIGRIWGLTEGEVVSLLRERGKVDGWALFERAKQLGRRR